MDYICTKCSYIGQRKKVNGGSNAVSLMLWVVLPVSYMLWQLNSIGPTMMRDPMQALQVLQGDAIGNVIGIVLTFAGPIYSIWRRLKKVYACPQCGERVMLPKPNIAEKMIADLSAEEISPESLKKIPFRWEKDVEEYKAKHPENGEDKELVIHADKNAQVNQVTQAASHKDNNAINGKNEW